MINAYIRVFILWLSDMVSIYGTWSLVVWGYKAIGIGTYRPEVYYAMWPVGLVYTLVNVMFRTYHGSVVHPASPMPPVEEFRRLIGSSLLTHMLVIVYLAMTYKTTEDYSRFVIAFSGIVVAFLSPVLRDIVRAIMFKLGIGQIPVILAGGSKAAHELAASLAGDRYTGFRIAADMGENYRAVVPEAKRLGVKILLACHSDVRFFKSQIEEYTKYFAHIEYFPEHGSFPIAGARVVAMDGLGGIEMVNQRRFATLRFEKWLLDKTLVTFAFIVFSPFFLFIPILIKLTSPGPVFYRQKRLGKDGKTIGVWKFRSMYRDADERLKKILAESPEAAAEWKANFKLKNDPRVTPLGAVLRKTSLDELPQLFNVITGDMAVVGPRPIVKDEVAYYGKAYSIFSSVPPGITGLWQASGRSDTDYGRRVALDVYYVLNWSPWMDIWIIIRTAFAVLCLKGSY